MHKSILQHKSARSFSHGPCPLVHLARNHPATPLAMYFALVHVSKDFLPCVLSCRWEGINCSEVYNVAEASYSCPPFLLLASAANCYMANNSHSLVGRFHNRSRGFLTLGGLYIYAQIFVPGGPNINLLEPNRSSTTTVQ